MNEQAIMWEANKSELMPCIHQGRCNVPGSFFLLYVVFFSGKRGSITHM
jgi:hypothetical protein